MNKIITLLGLAITLSGFAVSTFGQRGCISGDCENGFGTWRWESGAIYIGEFKNKVRNGYGYYKFKNGDEYIGDWKNSRRHGYGVYLYSGHPKYRKYAGQWSDNERTGMGIMHYKDATPYKYGQWEANRFKISSPLDGCQTGDCYDGFGVYVWKDGSKFEGMYKNGKRSGQGIYYYPKGGVYSGSFQDNKRHGLGTYYYTSGKRYVGGWKEEAKHGKGRIFQKGSIAKQGCWNDGVYIGSECTEGSNTTPLLADKTGPVINITRPAVVRGTGIVVASNEVVVSGTVTDESGIKRVRVHGYIAKLANQGTTTKGFAAKVIFAERQNQFWVEAEDKFGNISTKKYTVAVSTPVAAKERPEGSEKRSALIIGNADYKSMPLRNPVNDARAMATKLEDLGFDVSLHTNISQNQMKQAVNNFSEKLKNDGGVGMFYYAGHGLQEQGQNYLVPINAKIRKPSDIELEAVQLQRILNSMQDAANRLNIVVLDACRDNPYGNGGPLWDLEKTRGQQDNGFEPVVAPFGTFIAYSTAPGRAASDGSGQHGLYTEELLKVLDHAHGMKLEDIFKRVRSNVRKRSKSLQIPWENSSVEGDFYFIMPNRR